MGGAQDEPGGEKALQLVGVAAILGVGSELALSLRENPTAVAAIIGLVAIGLVQSAWGMLDEEPPPPANETAAAPNRNLDVAVDGMLVHLVAAFKRFLSAQRDYQENLSGFNAGLSQFPSRQQVQDIIAKLMNNNVEMQAKVSNLSRDLEASQQQIVDLRQNVNEVGKIAMIDALTELGNRRYFDQTLQDEVARARAEGSDLSLAMADIDRFKTVNDRFGHLVGDQLLRSFADLLAQQTKDSGLVARYGGEEFALMFPDTGIEVAALIVEKIRRELELKVWTVPAKETRLGVVTASFGIARLGAQESATSLVRRADLKLLEAKNAGRNRVVVDRRGPEVSLDAEAPEATPAP